MLMNVASLLCPFAGYLQLSLLWAAAGLNMAVCMMPCVQQYHVPLGFLVSFLFLLFCGVLLHLVALAV